MSEDLPDPTPVSGELEGFGYRPPRLRITATYDSTGTSRPSSLEVEIHDDDTPAPEVIRQIVGNVAHVLTHVGAAAAKSVTSGTWTSGGHAQVLYTEGGAAA